MMGKKQEIHIDVGDFLRNLRKTLNVTQEGLAELLGRDNTRSLIAGLENGKPVHLSTLVLLRDKFGLSVDELLDNQMPSEKLE